MRPADAGDLAAAPIPAFPPDAAQHVFAEAVRRGITEARHLVHLGDGAARCKLVPCVVRRGWRTMPHA